MAYQPEPTSAEYDSAQLARELRRVADEMARLKALIEALDARVTALEGS